MLTYKQLLCLLTSLELEWILNSINPHPLLGGYDPVLAPKALHPLLNAHDPISDPKELCADLQYFVIDSATNEIEEPLPVIILIGINYTQREHTHIANCAAPLRPSLRDSLRSAYTHMRDNVDKWKESALVSQREQDIPMLPKQFHLVLSNLSPWVTEKRWNSQLCNTEPARSGHLLFHPPFAPKNLNWPYDHLASLQQSLSGHVFTWVGHGKYEVHARWPSLVNGLELTRWFLIGNLFFSRTYYLPSNF